MQVLVILLQLYYNITNSTRTVFMGTGSLPGPEQLSTNAELKMPTMAIRVVEFSGGGYKIRKILA